MEDLIGKIQEIEEEELINCKILLQNKQFVAKELGLHTDYMSNPEYIRLLNAWNITFKGAKKQLQMYDMLKESSQFKSSFSDKSCLSEKSVVYFITLHQKLLYIGSTTGSYDSRYNPKKVKRTRLLSLYERANSVHFADEEIFVRHFEPSQIRKAESKYINAITAFGIPTCNIKCEGLELFDVMHLYKKIYCRKSLTDFLNIVWNIDLRKVRAKLAA